MNMKKAKFAGLNFGSSEVLLKDAQKKVNGGTGYCYDYCGNFIGCGSPCGKKMCDTRKPSEGQCPSGYYIACSGGCW
jgi:hypothetical protein